MPSTLGGLPSAPYEAGDYGTWLSLEDRQAIDMALLPCEKVFNEELAILEQHRRVAENRRGVALVAGTALVAAACIAYAIKGSRV